MVSLQAEPRTYSQRDAVNAAVYHNLTVSAWRGSPMDKCPTDLLVYQEIIAALRPSIIVETGTWYGGSALFLADMCELNGCGRVLSVDIAAHGPLPKHPRLTFLCGDSIDVETVAEVTSWANGEQGMVILDSAHEVAHVAAELDAYHHLVDFGQYLIVEDTNINGHPVRPELGPGPAEAVAAWLPHHPSFAVDSVAEPYVTFAPGGYLHRSTER